MKRFVCNIRDAETKQLVDQFTFWSINPESASKDGFDLAQARMTNDAIFFSVEIALLRD